MCPPFLPGRRWQPTDYADFRVNYATHMHDPSIELQEQELENGTASALSVPVASNADAPGAAENTATVEGVLVVAASPAPAPLASRSVNPTVTPARAGGVGSAWQVGGSDKVGNGAGGRMAAPSQDRQWMPTRHGRVRALCSRCLTLTGLSGCCTTSPHEVQMFFSERRRGVGSRCSRRMFCHM